MSETGLPVRDAGEELVEGRKRLEIDEAHWLEVLADFDRSQLWSLDGCFTAAEWLEERCGMARSTAYEKLHIAHELRRRPDLAKAMAAGELFPMCGAHQEIGRAALGAAGEAGGGRGPLHDPCDHRPRRPGR